MRVYQGERGSRARLQGSLRYPPFGTSLRYPSSGLLLDPYPGPPSRTPMGPLSGPPFGPSSGSPSGPPFRTALHDPSPTPYPTSGPLQRVKIYYFLSIKNIFFSFFSSILFIFNFGFGVLFALKNDFIWVIKGIESFRISHFIISYCI